MKLLTTVVNHQLCLKLAATAVLTVVVMDTLPATADTYTANDFTSLTNAINSANSTPGANTIKLTSDIKLSGLLPLINSDIHFVGKNYAINGGGKYPGFFVNGGTVTVNKVIFSGDQALGGSGGRGGGGSPTFYSAGGGGGGRGGNGGGGGGGGGSGL